MAQGSRHRVVIVGGGFGGLNAALALKRHPVDLTLIDRDNVHVFQPLLYQVATGGLSPGDISSPLRAVLRRQANTRVWMADVTGVDPHARCVRLADGREVTYDTLLLATGAANHYFGHGEWERLAPSLKTLEDAVEIRGRVLSAFELAECADDPETQGAYLTFVVVGGGPTGVELAGALSELARDTLRRDFRAIDPRTSRILLVEATDRILPTFPPRLSFRGKRSLERIGVEVLTQTALTNISDEGVVLTSAGQAPRFLPARTVLWAAGVRATSLASLLADSIGARLDRTGRVMVESDLTVPGHPEIFVIGDLAHCRHHETGEPLPGIAPVAMQQGRYVGRVIVRRLAGRPVAPFRYRDKGQLATIGRAAAVADLGRYLRFSGYPAWLLWLFVHLMYLVEFQNRVLVFIQWAWHYFTWNRGARIIANRRPPSRA